MFNKIVIILLASQLLNCMQRNKELVERIRDKIIAKGKSGSEYSTDDINTIKRTTIGLKL